MPDLDDWEGPPGGIVTEIVLAREGSFTFEHCMVAYTAGGGRGGLNARLGRGRWRWHDGGLVLVVTEYPMGDPWPEDARQEFWLRADDHRILLDGWGGCRGELLRTDG
jgi:hypothetical protein